MYRKSRWTCCRDLLENSFFGLKSWSRSSYVWGRFFINFIVYSACFKHILHRFFYNPSIRRYVILFAESLDIIFCLQLFFRQFLNRFEGGLHDLLVAFQDVERLHAGRFCFFDKVQDQPFMAGEVRVHCSAMSAQSSSKVM